MKKRGKKMQLNMTGIYTKLYAITDHTPCDVDTPKRLGAYIVDWVVGGIFTGLPAVLLYSGLTKNRICLVVFMFLNHLDMHEAGLFWPGHSVFCLHCFILYMSHGAFGRGRHWGSTLPVIE